MKKIHSFMGFMLDIVIIGSGPAGLSCAIYLAQHGKKSVLLEKRNELSGKVCGDGLSIKCLETLSKLEITPEELLSFGGNLITHKYEIISSYMQEVQYNSPAIGLSRDKLEEYLYQKALSYGVDIRLENEVFEVKKYNDYFLINGVIKAKKVIYACGIASKFNCFNIKDLPLGISSRIVGKSEKLKSDAFYFKYDEKYGNGYAWIFPIGKDLWNIGVWNSDKKTSINEIYQVFEKKVLNELITFEKYDRKPSGALIGASKEKVDVPSNYIGDLALLASYSSGEGITYAIESAIEIAKKCL